MRAVVLIGRQALRLSCCQPVPLCVTVKHCEKPASTVCASTSPHCGELISSQRLLRLTAAECSQMPRLLEAASHCVLPSKLAVAVAACDCTTTRCHPLCNRHTYGLFACYCGAASCQRGLA